MLWGGKSVEPLVSPDWWPCYGVGGVFRGKGIILVQGFGGQ